MLLQRHLLNHKFSEMGLFGSCSIDFLKLQLDSKSRFPIPEFSVYHCNLFTEIVLQKLQFLGGM